MNSCSSPAGFSSTRTNLGVERCRRRRGPACVAVWTANSRSCRRGRLRRGISTRCRSCKGRSPSGVESWSQGVALGEKRRMAIAAEEPTSGRRVRRFGDMVNLLWHDLGPDGMAGGPSATSSREGVRRRLSAVRRRSTAACRARGREPRRAKA